LVGQKVDENLIFRNELGIEESVEHIFQLLLPLVEKSLIDSSEVGKI